MSRRRRFALALAVVTPFVVLVLTERVRLQVKVCAWGLDSKSPAVRAAARTRLVQLGREVADDVWPKLIASAADDLAHGRHGCIAIGRPLDQAQDGVTGVFLARRRPGQPTTGALYRLDGVYRGGPSPSWTSVGDDHTFLVVYATPPTERALAELGSPSASKLLIVLGGEEPATSLLVSLDDESLAPRVIEAIEVRIGPKLKRKRTR